MSTLTNGWRFTLPAAVRDAVKWNEGMPLLATVVGQALHLTERSENRRPNSTPEATGPADHVLSGTPGAAWAGPSSECYLGAGGKVIVPAVLRDSLRWVPGKRLTVAESDGMLVVTPCCALTRCRSCGSTVGVREIIPNVYLCESCWGEYVTKVRQTHVLPAQRRSL